MIKVGELMRIRQWNLSRYMMTYTNVYNYCTAAGSNQGRDGSGRAMPRGSKPTRGKQSSSAGFIGAELYERLKAEIMKRVDEIHQQGSTKVCAILEWSEYLRNRRLIFLFSSTVDCFYFIPKLGQIFNFLSKYWMAYVHIWIVIGSLANVTNGAMIHKKKFMLFLIWELFNGKKYYMENFINNWSMKFSKVCQDTIGLKKCSKIISGRKWT